MSFKRKILYRSQHRGIKEMDLLLTNFVKKYINGFNKNELMILDDLLKIDDDLLFKWYSSKNKTHLIQKNKVSTLLKNFKIKTDKDKNGGEGGIRTHE